MSSGSTSHDVYMRRALDLAQLGAGAVSPNPMVGCVIVHKGAIIGEGWHRSYGGPHAEPNAIADVKNRELLPHSTLYVTLEPCSHFGKTPPCADLLIKEKIPQVVIATADPFEKVNGSGIEKLRAAGVEVTVGVLEQEARALNKRFFTYHLHQRPYVLLKCAQTYDGFVAGEDGTPVHITDNFSNMLSHRMRAEEDAILVGYRTALHDNPKLTTRNYPGRNPVRCLIDKDLAIPDSFSLMDGAIKTLIFNNLKSEMQDDTEFIKIDFSRNTAAEILNELYKRKILSLIVEGGPATHRLFLDKGLWDEAAVFQSSKSIGCGLAAAVFPGLPAEVHTLVADRLFLYRRQP